MIYIYFHSYTLFCMFIFFQLSHHVSLHRFRYTVYVERLPLIFLTSRSHRVFTVFGWMNVYDVLLHAYQEIFDALSTKRTVLPLHTLSFHEDARSRRRDFTDWALTQICLKLKYTARDPSVSAIAAADLLSSSVESSHRTKRKNSFSRHRRAAVWLQRCVTLFLYLTTQQVYRNTVMPTLYRCYSF